MAGNIGDMLLQNVSLFPLSWALQPFFTFTVNLHWPDYKALMRGDGVFADSAIAAIRFKIKLSALMNCIQKHQILGKFSAFGWRIEYQKEVLYMLMSSFGLTSIPNTLMPLMH
jgi:hypothetical protein